MKKEELLLSKGDKNNNTVQKGRLQNGDNV